MTLLKLDVSSILNHPGSTIAFELEEKISSPVEGVSLPEGVSVRGVATSLGQHVYIEGEAAGRVELVCSRCLTDFGRPFEVAFEGKFVPEEMLEGWTKDEDETEVYGLDGTTCDLSVMVLQEILLNLPMKPLCSPGCKGLCPVCGQNRNEGSCMCPETPEDLTPFGKKFMDALAERSKKDGRT